MKVTVCGFSLAFAVMLSLHVDYSIGSVGHACMMWQAYGGVQHIVRAVQSAEK